MSTGLDALRNADFAPLRGKRVGLVTHPAALDSQFRSAMELFAERVNLVALFGPEHGITGEAQDLIPVADGVHGPLRVHSLYGDTFDSLKPTATMLADLDVLVIDLVDVGSRYYTYQATMLYCLEACAAVGLPVLVLDRHNPTGLLDVEGPTIRPGFESFVGPHPICTRHGMTIGELAKLYQAERVPAVDLTVLPCHDTRESGVFILHPTDFAVPPSPNMPTQKTAHVYPGMCLIEGTNLSEGRGTTRPFEYVGFPGLSPTALVQRLRRERVLGVQFLPATFRPTFQKHAGRTCGGCMLAIEDYDLFQPVRVGLAVLCAFRELLGDAFRWRTERYEFVDHIPAIDLLFGSDRERRAIESGAAWQDVSAAWETEEAAFRERRKPHLLYRE
jgi:uncharacterized protein YbbC (DUF1343 family)